MNIAQVQYSLFILAIISKCYYTQTQENPEPQARIQCYDCQENNFGNCAKGLDIKTKRCFDKATSCYGTVFYSPYNNGYGAKYMFSRGCSTCNTSECLLKDTQHGFGLLPEYIGNHFICQYALCNSNPLEEFKVDFELGIKPH